MMMMCMTLIYVFVEKNYFCTCSIFLYSDLGFLKSSDSYMHV